MSRLITVSDQLEFCLSNGRISYLLRVSPEGVLEHLHVGAAVDLRGQLSAVPRREVRAASIFHQGIDNYNLDDTPQEYPLYGTSDTRYPALHFINGDGNTVNDFKYASHQILSDKPAINGLPSSRGGDSATLIVSLQDPISEVLLNLHYTVFAEHDVIARSLSICNQSEQPITLLHALSSSIDLPSGDYDLVHLSGSWAREFNTQRHRVLLGRFVVESSRGTSSNAHNPFLAIMDQHATEHHGDVLGTALMYSGNFCINVETGEFGGVRVSTGINPFNFAWQLAPNEVFNCPEALHAFSPSGLNGMSQVWHKFIKQKVTPKPFQGVARPSYLNSWEAHYFDVDQTNVMALAAKAKSLGLQMLVLDDGWFVGRNDDTSSLGDWFSDADKFPDGVQAVAQQVNDLGLKFGLWFEPEMVNQTSQLYQQHPDWLLHVPRRVLSTGRNQYTLDLSRAEVVEYLYQRLDSFLRCGHINYIKWDMNRMMTEVGSPMLPASQQQEVAHRYLLGLYELLRRLTEQYPQVLFENCASGGNRFDLGMMHYMSQCWVSDMSEPMGRLPIINGASLLYPPCTLAAYIGPVPSHQNGRLVSLKTRAEVGFFCAARGLSLNMADIEQDETAIKSIIQHYQHTADDVANGQFYRVFNHQNEVCWQLNSADGQRIYLGYFHLLSMPNAPYRRAKLLGLDAAGRYQLECDSAVVYGGDSLMNLGINLPYLGINQDLRQHDYTQYLDAGDFTSALLTFTRVA